MKKSKRLRLFLLTQQENNSYDTFDSIVVAAQTEDDARQIHPYGLWEKKYTGSSSAWASSPKKVDVQLLGVAEPDIESGIILRSFNAG